MARKLVTISEGRCFQGCARKHHIRYDQGIRPVESAGPLRFGHLIHTGLESWWKSQGDALQDAFAALQEDAHKSSQEAPIDAYGLVTAEEMLRLYDARWGAENYEVLAVEVEFRTELRNPATGAASRTYDLGGKIDAVCRDLSTGRVLIVEHKTSSEDITPGSAYWKKLRLDNQVSTYFVGARSLGFDASACLYDVLLKPGLKPKRATPEADRKYTKEGKLYANQRLEDESPEEFRIRLREELAGSPDRYLVRGEVARLEEEEWDAASDLWQVSQLIREGQNAGRYPRNPGHCETYHRLCEYFDVCTGNASLTDSTRFRTVETAHEELSQGDQNNAA